MMLWIKNAPSPQEIHDKILDPNSDFQKLIVEYLEGVHMGEFFNGPMEHIHLRVESKENESDSPTLTLPEHAPTQCKIHSNDDNCQQCIRNKKWWSKYKDTVDHIVFQSIIINATQDVDRYIKVDKVVKGDEHLAVLDSLVSKWEI